MDLKLLLNKDIYTAEYFLTNQVCRFCWNLSFESDIKPELNLIDITEEIIDKIYHCLSIVLNENNVNKICYNCCDRIDKFYDFKMFCNKTNSLLNKIFYKEISEANINNNQPNKPETLVEDLKTSFDDDSKIAKVCLSSTCPEPLEINNKIMKEKKQSNHYKHQNMLLCCDICQKKFKDSDTFIAHKNSMHGVISEDAIEFSKPITKIKQTKEQLLSTNQKSDNESSYCYICHEIFKGSNNFTAHNTKAHGISSRGTFKCFGCEKEFNCRRSRLGHERNYCKSMINGYKCSICGKYLAKRRVYNSHMRAHKNNSNIITPECTFECNKCEQSFENKKDLKVHCAVHQKKNFICETCGRAFARPAYLRQHITTHTGIKDNSCPHCEYKTSQKSSLVIHLRKHTGERPYACDLCPQRCISISNLHAHRRRHLGVKKYECMLCPKKFGYKSSLEEHIAGSHDRPQSHPCVDCGAVYARRRELQRHLLAKHAKRTGDCDVTTV